MERIWPQQNAIFHNNYVRSCIKNAIKVMTFLADIAALCVIVGASDDFFGGYCGPVRDCRRHPGVRIRVDGKAGERIEPGVFLGLEHVPDRAYQQTGAHETGTQEIGL